MSLRLPLAVLAVVALAGLGGCGGGGGGGHAVSSLLTADTRGTSGGGALPAAATAEAPGGTAKGAADAIAREIEEADLYRADGDFLYLLNPWRGLVVVDLAQRTLAGRVDLRGVPREMYVGGGRALVCLATFDGGGEVVDVDVSDPDAPSVRARFSLAGPVVASRRVGAVLYVVTPDEVRSFLVGADVAPVDTEPLPSGAAFVHATDTLLAVAAPSLDGATTRVTLVDVSDVAGAVVRRGSVDLAGWVSDEFKLHVGGGNLRVVTHDFVDGGLSRLFTVSLADLDAPSVLGTLELARGEQLFATRFTDDVAYVVTFEQVDPLWVVDLRDPAHPSVAGELTVPGWSTHVVALPGRLVALGLDASAGWTVTASLFDVSDPASPALLDRVDFGTGWSQAFSDVKALGVFPSEGRVLVPVSGEVERLAVLDLTDTTLDLRGSIDLEGVALRGFPHARGVVAITTEEVVVADPSTLAVLGRVTVAEDVVDAARLPDGRLLDLVARRSSGRLGPVALPLVPDRCYPAGATVAVTGWDATGRAAYVVDFGPATPALSARFDLGGAWYPIYAPMAGLSMPVMAGSYGAPDALLSAEGRLVVRGLPGAYAMDPGQPAPRALATAGSGATDGFVVIDVPRASLEAPVEVSGGCVSGFALDGERLVYTVGTFARTDDLGRPWMQHDATRVDLAKRSQEGPVTVPGYVVAARDGLLFTVEEKWGQDWAYTTALVASSLAGGTATTASRLALPDGAFDFRAAGGSLFFTSGGGWWGVMMDGGVTTGTGGGTMGGGMMGGGMMGTSGGTTSGGGMMAMMETGFGNVAGGTTAPPPGMDRPAWGGFGVAVAPTTAIQTVHLGPSLSFGPSVDPGDGFATLLLPLDGAALVVRDGVAVEVWDLSGPTALLDDSFDVGTYPCSARPDTAPGQYLLALGYGGLLRIP